MRHAPIPTLQDPVRQSISTVLKTLKSAETSAPKRTKKVTLPQRSRWDAISVLRNSIMIAKPNRFAADVIIIIVKNAHDSLAFSATAKSATIFTFCRKRLYPWMQITVGAKNVEEKSIPGWITCTCTYIPYYNVGLPRNISTCILID